MNTTRNRHPLQPVSGTCQWIHQPIWPSALVPDGLPGLLLVTTDQGDTVYMVTAHIDDTANAILGFRLTKSDGKTYDIDPTFWTCDCPDGTYRQNRPGGCKHSKAIRAAIARLGINTALEPKPVHDLVYEPNDDADSWDDPEFAGRWEMVPENEDSSEPEYDPAA